MAAFNLLTIKVNVHTTFLNLASQILILVDGTILSS